MEKLLKRYSYLSCSSRTESTVDVPASRKPLSAVILEPGISLPLCTWALSPFPSLHLPLFSSPSPFLVSLHVSHSDKPSLARSSFASHTSSSTQTSEHLNLNSPGEKCDCSGLDQFWPYYPWPKQKGYLVQIYAPNPSLVSDTWRVSIKIL